MPRPLSLEALEGRDLLSIAAPMMPQSAVLRPLAGTGSPSVFTPAQVRRAYGFDKLPYDGSGQTIAIVVAFDDARIQADLATFDSTFGLPAPPSFTKVKLGNPGADSGWASETALDVEWAHAIAPKANLLLVEATTDSGDDLLTAVDYARKQPGVVVVSMSWGGPEFNGQNALDSYFTTPAGHLAGSSGRPGSIPVPGGVTFVAASGDEGAGAIWPAASANVLTVGGTTLTTDQAGNYVSESAWGLSGGGRSSYEAEPSWQRGVQTSGKRAVPDVAYVGDPGTGLYVYDSVPDSTGYSGWLAMGGTSAGTPQWAGLVALADQERGQNGLGAIGNAQSALYSLPAADFHDITTGSNGFAAGPGYDLVTGRGSPRADLAVKALFGATPAPPVSGPTVTVHTAARPANVHAAALAVAFPSLPLASPSSGEGAQPLVAPLAPLAHAELDSVLWADLAKLRELAAGERPTEGPGAWKTEDRGEGEDAVGLAAPEGLW